MVIILVAGLIVIFMDANGYENAVLFQRLEQCFTPAKSWQECQLPLTSAEFWQKVSEEMPGYFNDFAHFEGVILQLHYIRSYNEHNHKWYWLVNPALPVVY